MVSLGAALWYREHGRLLTADGVHSHLGRLPQIVFFAVLFAATAYALIESFEWTYAAALFPRSIAIVTLLLLAPLGLFLLLAKSPSTAFYDSKREEFSADVEQHSNEYFLLWLLGYVGIIALVGFTLGSAAFVYVFMWRKAQVSASHLCAERRCCFCVARRPQLLAWHNLCRWVPADSGFVVVAKLREARTCVR